MANNVANDIIYFLVIDINNKTDLANIRQWNNLKIAFDVGTIWVKDFSYAQIHSIEVKSIPYKTVYYAKDGKLYLLNSLLPNKNIPSLLWTPIERALPIQLPSFNHNYFGINEQVEINIIPSIVEENSVALIVLLKDLKNYIYTAPNVRLKKIKWCILNNDKALLLGIPFLPIKGNAYWQRSDFLLPAGFDFDMFILSDFLNKKLNPNKQDWIIWNTEGSYFPVAKTSLKQLSISSFKLTFQNLSVPQF
ncbi:MAG: hypothetical protein ACOVO1_03585 [Chitinophagaceae bacterium]